MEVVRVVAISCVRDESDIVEPFVRHTLTHVDRLVILDNGSTDGTRQLLQSLIDEGLPLEVVDDPSPGHYHWRRMTHLMHAHALQRHSAEWTVPLDVDEFLTVDNLSDFLRQESQQHPLGIPWRTYVPDLKDNANETNPVLRIRHRLRDEARLTIKVLIPSALVRNQGVTIGQGSHFLLDGGRSFVSGIASKAFLDHFPGRSPGQFARKVAVKHLQYLSMGDRSPNWGFHYRATIETLRKNVARLEADFQRTIMFYNLPDGEHFQPELIVAPLDYRGGPLKYTPVQSDRSLIESMLECAEMIARGHGALSKEQHALVADLKKKEAALVALHQSSSWRIGRAVTSPVRWIKQGLRQVTCDNTSNGSVVSRGKRRAA